MAAEFDKTSFGMQRRRLEAERIKAVRQLVIERIGFVKDTEKLDHLERLLAAIDVVLIDLNE